MRPEGLVERDGISVGARRAEGDAPRNSMPLDDVANVRRLLRRKQQGLFVISILTVVVTVTIVVVLLPIGGTSAQGGAGGGASSHAPTLRPTRRLTPRPTPTPTTALKTSAGTCLSAGWSVACDYGETECAAIPGGWYPPGYISRYGNKCCHCEGSCDHALEGSPVCSMGFEYRDHFRCGGDGGCCVETWTPGVCEKRSRGSCDTDGSVVCDVSEASCEGEWRPEGHVLADGRGCCVCGAGCDHGAEASDACADGADYRDSVACVSADGAPCCTNTTYNGACTAMNGEAVPSPAPTPRPTRDPGACDQCGGCYAMGGGHEVTCLEEHPGDDACPYWYASYDCPDGTTCQEANSAAGQACLADFGTCCGASAGAG